MASVQCLGIDRRISMYRDAEMYYYHEDALGSVCQMIEEDETVVRTKVTFLLSTPFSIECNIKNIREA